MKLINEFKEFAIRGNLIDMSIAFVMGGAFGALVNKFNEGLVMPIIGLLTAETDFNGLRLIIKAAQLDEAGAIIKPEIVIKYGEFFTVLLNLFIISIFMFVVIKIMNKIRKEPDAAPVAPTLDQQLLKDIKEILEKKS
jgi:large conductance mechanosensitive channel